MKNKLKVKKKHIYWFIALLIIFLIIFAYKSTNNFEKKKIRTAAVAGSWYPGDKVSLQADIEKYLANVNKVGLNGTIKALIVPHAGYRFSGQVAGTAFRQLREDYETVIILAPSHTSDFIGASIPDVTHYETPLGLVKISEKSKKLLEENFFQSHPTAHAKEHAIEIELPFIQTVLKDFEIIPILIGASTTPDELDSIAQTLKKYVDDKTLIIVSSDFTHYGPNYGYMPFTENIAENLKNLDLTAVDRILSKDTEGFLEFLDKSKDTICGRHAITILLYMFKDENNIKPYHLYYTTSGALTDDYTNSVSYVTMAFVEEGNFPQSQANPEKQEKEILGKEEQDVLLKLARDTMELYVREGKVLQPDMDIINKYPNLLRTQGVFVSLDKLGRLRGSIGHLLPVQELYLDVRDNAINAVAKDNRFKPVEQDELPDIKATISVLTIAQLIEVNNPEEYIKKLVPFEDGVIIQTSSGRTSTYLPQVWSSFATGEEFLSALCQKQGASEDCWKKPSTGIYRYSAQVFSE